MREEAKGMDTIDTPVVSVVMAVYNGERHLRETVSSILSQMFTNFEYIIVNDGSTDRTAELLQSFSDARIMLLHNEQNQGLPYSLNRGLEHARGTYIARIDAGDLAVKERLEAQVAYLEQHPEHGILGSACLVLDDSGQTKGRETFPVTDLDIRWRSLLGNPFLHPSIMLRRDVLVQHHLTYDTAFHSSQDYELWTRVLRHTCGANLKEPLILYRQSSESMTTKRRKEQLANHDRVALRTIRNVLPDVQISAEQLCELREVFAGGDIPRNQREPHKVRLAAWYLDLLAAYASTHSPHPDLRKLIRREIRQLCKSVFQPKYATYWLPVFTRAIRLSPGVPYFLFRRFLRKSFKKLT